jgi:hypothetical protein
VEGWRPRRASRFGPHFEEDLHEALGENHFQVWDETVCRDVEEVLCGASRHLLDYVYEPDE